MISVSTASTKLIPSYTTHILSSLYLPLLWIASIMSQIATIIIRIENNRLIVAKFKILFSEQGQQKRNLSLGPREYFKRNIRNWNSS